MADSHDEPRTEATAPKRLLRSYRVPEGRVEIQELKGKQTDVTSTLSDLRETDASFLTGGGLDD